MELSKEQAMFVAEALETRAIALRQHAMTLRPTMSNYEAAAVQISRNADLLASVAANLRSEGVITVAVE